MQDIHDIRPPVMVGMDPAQIRLLIWAGAGLAILLALVFLVLYILRHRRNRTVQSIESTIAPLDGALAELSRLESSFADIEPKRFYFELGRIVKAYMAQSFDTKFLEMTTEELIRTVRHLSLSRELRDRLALFQDLCDPFRYAPVTPSRNQIREDLSRARALIRDMEKEAS